MNTVKFDQIKGRTNQVQLRGNLTADPVLKTLGQGKLTELRLAVSRPVEIKGVKSEEVLFVDVDLRGAQVEAAAKFLKKGSPIFVEGALKAPRWEKGDQKHSKVVVTGFKVHEVQFKPDQSLTGYPDVVQFDELKKAEVNSNGVTLKANLTKDAEFRVTESGTKVASLRVAANRKYKDSAGNQQEEVSYYNVTQYGDKAIETGKLTKGASIFIEGKLNLDEWTTKGDAPQKRTAITLYAFDVALVEQTQREEVGEQASAGQSV